jgi:uncharacterized protein (DUF305 family)
MYSSARHSQAIEQHHIAQGHTFKYNIIKFTQKYQTTQKKQARKDQHKKTTKNYKQGKTSPTNYALSGAFL